MKTNRLTVALTILIVFALSYAGAKLTGYWNTEAVKVPVKFQDGEFAGAYNPDDIRGSYSFSDVESAFEVPVDILGSAFNIPDEYDLETFQNKNLEEVYVLEEPYEIGNGSVKLFVALYKGLPYDYEASGDYLPAQAYEILLKEGKLDEQALDYFKSHVIDLASMSAPSGTESPELETPETSSSMENTFTENTSTENDSAENSSQEVSSSGTGVHDEDSEFLSIKGKTLFREVLDAGVSQEAIEGVLGMEMGHPLEEIRAYCMDKGLEFSTVKAGLQDLIDNQ